MGRPTLLSVLMLLAMSVLTCLALPIAALADGPSASGHGNLSGGGELRTFSFTAVTHKDGTVTGEAQLDNRGLPNTISGKFHLVLDCAVISGNTAVISGTITNSTVPSLEGDTGIFAVQDNGEGANASPDKISLVSFFTAGSANCRTFAFGAFAIIPIEAGNIQVRP